MPEGKWRVDHGIHRRTLTSRDSTSQEYDTEEAARKAFQESKEFYASIGYFIWYAYLISPEGKKTVLDPGTPYY